MNPLLKKFLICLLLPLFMILGITNLYAAKPKNLSLKINHQVFHLKVANTSALRNTGLSNIATLKADQGMLFVFDKASVQSFWMKDCLIDLDILFLDRHGTIIKTYTMKKEPLRQKDEALFHYYLRLKRYSSIKPAHYAIELSMGQIKRLDIKPGQDIAVLEALQKTS